MASAPNMLFNAITKLDSGDYANSTIGRLKFLLARRAGPYDREDFVDTPALQVLLQDYRSSAEQSAAREERRALDYALVYSRMPGVDNKALANLYTY